MSSEWAKAHLKREAPWPYMTGKQAANMLNVDPSMLSGVTNHFTTTGVQFRSTQILSPKDNPVRVYCRADVLAIAARLQEGSR